MNRILFLLGLTVLCMSALIQQIALTRVLSVISYFHLAFLSISMAMLGMTAGAVWAYLKGITEQQAAPLLPKVSFAYGVGTLISLLVLISTYMPATPGITSFAAITKIILCMAMPFSTAGLAISLCLTRGPGKIGIRYAVDLTGAALGCLLCIPLLNSLSGTNAVLFAGLLGFVAAWLFWAAAPDRAPLKSSYSVPLLVLLGIMSINSNPNTQIDLLNVKSNHSARVDYTRWNTFSQISITASELDAPFYWGPGAGASTTPQDYRWLRIDGMAGTPMYKFNGDYSSLGFLDYDITNLAYTIRHAGRAAVIGVGGGRDILAARHFGFDDVSAVELNPIIIDLLTKPTLYRDYANIAQDPKIHLYVDDGRSWFARTHEKFNLIQMSMIDTFAATGAGGFTLSENGLYTIEGWTRFFNALTPTGVLTVSRWYAPGSMNETGRVLSLAMATLLEQGITNPRDHIYLAGRTVLATLVLSRAPLTADELALLDQKSAALGFDVLVHPQQAITDPVLASIGNAQTVAAIQDVASRQLLDVSAPTDSRPFFFNQLKLLNLNSLKEALSHETAGVVSGNLRATMALLTVIVISAVAVYFVLLIPAHASTRAIKRSYVHAGTAYFFLIGFGFMMVEIGTIQRMSIFLGHPVHSLAIVLFSLILMTGFGSFLSDHVRLDHRPLRLVAYTVLLFLVLLLTTFIAPPILHNYESAALLTRALIVIGLIGPPALLMGFGFPVGMALAARIDATPTPWFWSINGTAGVLSSGVAVIISMNFSIPTTLCVGAASYLLLLIPALKLCRLAEETAH